MAPSIWAKPDADTPPAIDPALLAGLAGLTAKMPPVFAPPRADAAPAIGPDVAQGLGGGNAMPAVFQSTTPQVRMPTPIERATAEQGNRLEKLVAKDRNPWGTPQNHPGILGKIGHALNVATGGVNRRAAEESDLIKQLNAESLAEQQQALLGSEAGHNRAETGLEEAQTRRLEEPAAEQAGKWKPLFGGNGQVMTAPNGQIVEADESGNLRLMALPEGASVGREPKEATDAFDQWKRDPQKYQEFMAEMAKLKPSKALQGAYGGFGPAMLAYRMLNAAYNENPALLPVLAPMLTKMLAQPGETPEQAQALESTVATVPAAQPLDAQGRPIGLRQPAAPTGSTRSRGQFAEAVLPSINLAKRQIATLGDQLGPMAGRWNELYVEKVGAFGPQFSGLQTELKNIGTAWMRLHANSETAREEFEVMLRGAQTPANLEANLDAIAEQARNYVKEGQGRPNELPGGAGGAAKEPPRPANVPAGYHFDANGPKGAGWYK